MVWRFPWSDSIKKRACRYLLQRYLGQFLKEKLTLEQLSVDIYEGTGEIKDILLDVDVSRFFCFAYLPCFTPRNGSSILVCLRY